MDNVSTKYSGQNPQHSSMPKKGASRFFADSKQNYSYSFFQKSDVNNGQSHSPRARELNLSQEYTSLHSKPYSDNFLNSDMAFDTDFDFDLSISAKKGENGTSAWKSLPPSQLDQSFSNSFTNRSTQAPKEIFKNDEPQAEAQVKPRSISKGMKGAVPGNPIPQLYSDSSFYPASHVDFININSLPNSSVSVSASAHPSSGFFVPKSLLELDELNTNDSRVLNPSMHHPSSYHHSSMTIDLGLSRSTRDNSTNYHPDGNINTADINTHIMVNALVDSDGEGKSTHSHKLNQSSNSNLSFSNKKTLANFNSSSTNTILRAVSTPPKRLPDSRTFTQNVSSVGNLTQHLSNVTLTDATPQEASFGNEKLPAYYSSAYSQIDPRYIQSGNVQPIEVNSWYQSPKNHMMNNQLNSAMNPSVYREHDDFTYPMHYQKNNFRDESSLSRDIADNTNNNAQTVSAYPQPFGTTPENPNGTYWVQQIEPTSYNHNNSINISINTNHNQNLTQNQSLNQSQNQNQNNNINVNHGHNPAIDNNHNNSHHNHHNHNHNYEHNINNNSARHPTSNHSFNHHAAANFNPAQVPYHVLNQNMVASVATQQYPVPSPGSNSVSTYSMLPQVTVAGRYNQPGLLGIDAEKQNDYYDFNQGYSVPTPIPIQQSKYPQQNGFPGGDHQPIPLNSSYNSVPAQNTIRNVTITPVGRNVANSNNSPLFSSISTNYTKPIHVNTAETPDQSTRSTVLEEFRNNKTRKYELQDIRGYIVEFSTDQYGSRYIQQKLETCPAEDKLMVFQEILPHALHLMSDVFGNYVIQKFFDYGSAPQKHMLALQMSNHILPLSLQMYGCRVVQKALEHVGTDLQTSIIRELDGYVLKCVKDQNGNHVIQKTIECVEASRIGFIINSFHGQVFQLATHPYGCRVIQRLFEHCADEKTRSLLDELQRYIPGLVQDQYGNYVIQHILEHGDPSDRTMIINKIKGNILRLSKHKFASNVVEKCIAYGNPVERRTLINEVIQVRQDDTSGLVLMMKDQYANYVVQKMLDVVGDDQRDELLAALQPHLSSLRRFTYGRHLINKVEALLSSKQISICNPGSESAPISVPVPSQPQSKLPKLASNELDNINKIVNPSISIAHVGSPTSVTQS